MYAQKGYWTLWVATLLFFAAFYTLIVPLPLYLTESGLPDWQVGVILGALGIASLVARPFAGTVADGRGRRPVMLFGTGALVVGAVGMTLTTRAPVLFGLRISQAIGYVAFSTAATALVADLVSPQHRGAAIARFGIAANLAMALTPAVVSVMLGVLTLSGAFWLCGVLAALAGALARRVQEPPREKKGFAWGGLLPVANKLRTPMMVAAMFGVGFGAFLQFLPLLTERRDLGVPGLTYTVYGIGIILTRLTAGRLLDGSKRRRMLPIAFLMLGVGLVGYAFAGSQAQLLVATLFIAAGSGILHPLLISVHVERVPPMERGRATAVFYLGFDLGIGLGAWILSPALQWLGLKGFYLLAALAVAAGIIPAREMLSVNTASNTLVTTERAGRN